MTVGWILEGDRDRFLEARDPTPSPAVIAQTFQCPFCKDSFVHPDQLNTHLQIHVVRRPFILIDGVQPGGEDVFRLGRTTPSVEAFNCTEIAFGVDGRQVRPSSAAALAKRLASTTRATFSLRLVNVGEGLTQPVIQEYRLRVSAPDEASLSKVDQLFIATLGTANVTLDAVDGFYEVTRNGAAAEYAEALGDYVRAVLLKDGDRRTGVSTTLHHYHDIDRRALNVLRIFERPLARLLCALMRFGLNDFSQWAVPSGFADLDQAFAQLGPLSKASETEIAAVPSRRLRRHAHVFVCPVDVGTDTVTRLSRQAAQLSRWGAAAEEQFRVLGEQANLDSYDRAKIWALWALAALRLRALTSAQTALSLLDGDPTFGEWAGSRLQ